MEGVVRLRDPGVPPARTLRFQSSVPFDGKVLLWWRGGIGIVEEPVPVYCFSVRCRVVTTDAAGTVLRISVDDLGVDNSAELAPRVVSNVMNAMAAFRSFSREIRLSPVGALDIGPRFKVLTRLLESALECPLPEEPVGIGAQWEADSTFYEATYSLPQTTRYQLAALSGDSLQIRFQALAAGVAPPSIRRGGEIVHGLKRTWTSTGTIRRDLRSLIPEEFREESSFGAVDLIKRGPKSRRDVWHMEEKLWARGEAPTASGAAVTSTALRPR
jgi:hypothetical protein